MDELDDELEPIEGSSSPCRNAIEVRESRRCERHGGRREESSRSRDDDDEDDPPANSRRTVENGWKTETDLRDGAKLEQRERRGKGESRADFARRIREREDEKGRSAKSGVRFAAAIETHAGKRKASRPKGTLNRAEFTGTLETPHRSSRVNFISMPRGIQASSLRAL